ncbi:hypothetical protein K3X44_09985 [Aliiroseovarius crassostreae]|uniref:hypothetical protein n=1 Tax=Aliiroseovarius crassostreae TaxID=154981 RepID=UPI0021FE7208|nr:hypothetical protein [Aliiroseovarius crassostreae]UWQ00844.1 hypothetical protein K3X44_09985 [Aliiroseovarius crassostreae]
MDNINTSLIAFVENTNLIDMFVIVAATLTFATLPGALRAILDVRVQKKADKKLISRMEEIEQKLQLAVDEATFAMPDNRDEWLNVVADRSAKQINVGLFQTFREKFSEELKLDEWRIQLDRSLERLYDGLLRERNVVSTRSGVNLLIGILLGGAGVWFLYLSIPSSNVIDGWNAGHSVQYGMRVVLAFFIHFLCFFFLALYRNGLQEIKFFRNELSNVDYIMAGLSVAHASKDSATIHQIALVLAKMERNFILKKGEATAGMLQHSFETERTSPTETAAILAELRKMNGSAQPNGKAPD